MNLKRYLVLLIAGLICLCSHYSWAQAPASLNGLTFDLTITAAGGGNTSSGNYTLSFSSNIYTVTFNGQPKTGAYTYSVANPSNGIVLAASGSHTNTITFSFTDANDGTYSSTNTVGQYEDGTFTIVTKLDYFGIGVNWHNVTNPPGLSGVRGDIGASNLLNHLQTDLSSTFGNGAVVPLDATGTTANNLNTIANQFGSFVSSVSPHDTVVFYVASHGGILNEYGLPAVAIVVSEDATNTNNIELDAVGINNLLGLLPASTRKVVILESCHAGGIASYLANTDTNISILAASSPSYQIIDGIVFGGTSFAAPDGTGVFTDSLIKELDRGVYELHQIVSDINANNGALYTTLLGSNLYLEDSGTAVFSGLQPQLYEGIGFTGTLASNTVSVVQSPPTITKAMIVTNSFQMTVTNVPGSGSIAIEASTNLISWLQVAFNAAAGTNLNYSFPVTNMPNQFFRAKVTP